MRIRFTRSSRAEWVRTAFRLGGGHQRIGYPALLIGIRHRMPTEAEAAALGNLAARLPLILG